MWEEMGELQRPTLRTPGMSAFLIDTSAAPLLRIEDSQGYSSSPAAIMEEPNCPSNSRFDSNLWLRFRSSGDEILLLVSRTICFDNSCIRRLASKKPDIRLASPIMKPQGGSTELARRGGGLYTFFLVERSGRLGKLR